MNAPAALRPDSPTRARFTVDDVARMVEAGLIDAGQSTELLEGEVLLMPSEGAAHIAFKAVLTRAFNRALPDSWWVAPDSTLHLSPEDAPEPDLYLLPAGAPLQPVDPATVALVVEIADSSLAHDLGRKASVYAVYGIAEYWVIDLRARRTHVLTRPEAGAYRQIDVVGFGAPLGPAALPDLVLTFDALVPPSI